MTDAAASVPSPDPADAPAGITAKGALRRRLIAARLAMPDRDARVGRLLAELGAWLARRDEAVVGAYSPIRGEPDLLPLLGTWLGAGQGRAVGLPVVDPVTSRLVYRGWHPGVKMQDDAYGIPTPRGTAAVDPQVLLVPCVGFGPGGLRLGYGGGFFDRMLAGPGPLPLTVGIAFADAFVSDLAPEVHDIPLDIILTDAGIAWHRQS
jgi:5,10-methenyltetrahydrofolate synthetase